MPRIFISYVHEDLAVAEALQKLLQKELYLTDEVFLAEDKTHILAGDVWLDSIRKGIRGSEIVIAMISARAFARPWVHFEAGAAWLSPRRHVAPVCYGNMKKGTLPFPYAVMHTLQLPEDAQYLVNSLRKKLEIPPREEHPLTGAVKLISQVIDMKMREPGDTSPSALDLTDPYKTLERALASWHDEPRAGVVASV